MKFWKKKYYEPSPQEQADYESLMKEFERDSKHVDFSLPKEWDDDFHQAIDDTLHRSGGRVRTVRKVVAAAAILLMVGGCGLVLSGRQVQGENVREFFKGTFIEEKWKHLLYGTSEEYTVNVVQEANKTDIYFKGNDLQEISKNIREELKHPMFSYEDIFEDYEIIEAKYNKEFMFLMITLKTERGYIYITQDNLINNTGYGFSIPDEDVVTVYNRFLDRYIDIQECTTSYANKNYFFEIKYENVVFCFDGAVSLEDCEYFAEHLTYG